MEINLEVDVSGGKISSIKILSHETGMKKSEKIIPRIIEKQSLDVDSISGATASSKMILQTVEKAIIGQGQE
ncbi:FMN-binding protein [Myxococcota bacterium]|nr:FMN-binding protein [Myxococcota bacterium]MBU1381183.1 FMN-binding protein [Myxococcota bacterium]MBU1498781.1 FMN-binding protein [Myxococcota bacterium]